MQLSRYINNKLTFSGVDLESLALKYGTPAFLYCQDTIEQSYLNYKSAFGDSSNLICYAVKANSNLSILNLIKNLGSGFDIVSGGELERLLKIGVEPSKIVFSGVGKSTSEIELAVVNNIGSINIESEAELDLVAEIAEKKHTKAFVSLRVNPNVDPKTHPYIATGLKNSKFGVPIENALTLYKKMVGHQYLQVVGVACHIGSQILDLKPFRQAISEIMQLVHNLERNNVFIQRIDCGGGLGINYVDQSKPEIEKLVEIIKKEIPEKYQIILEPGRSIVGRSGILIAKVEYIKKGTVKNFLVVDAAMNDLVRPSLYQAEHEVLPCNESLHNPETFDIVGPICETGDWLAKDKSFSVKRGDYIAVLDVGAYSFSMSSNYNTRPRSVELLVDKNKTLKVIRKREKVEELFSNELQQIF
ncbi:MAG: diaminopimelate decarboxylase [Pseudomonadota bacterium]|nr:diaminopimelate decarboxylase [Pseudomonadota bacterium]